MGKLFGTDGIRGVANETLDCTLAYKAGLAAAVALAEEKHGKAKIMIGKDTRLSSDMLEAAFTAGVCAAGADAVLLGVIPTPAVAYLTADGGADAGVVISASHNPYEHNGIKMFNGEGYKLSDELEAEIERLMLSEQEIPLRTGADIGRVHRAEDAADRYIKHVAGTAVGPYTGLRAAIDCSNGAASRTARRLFESVGLHAEYYFDSPDGVNVNAGCGSTHLKALSSIVKKGGFDLGIAFDGDADRCLIVDEKGSVVDGDHIMAACGIKLKSDGRLRGDTIVATVMSNLGFHVYARENGIKLVSAAIGDRNVLEEMRKGGYVLGGEQSGHLIFLDHATTGDGQLTAVQFLNVLKASGKKVSELMEGIPQYPQILLNIKVAAKSKNKLSAYPAIGEQIKYAEDTLGEDGRVLVRPSGTEPLVRVMVEGKDGEMVESLARRIADEIQKTVGE